MGDATFLFNDAKTGCEKNGWKLPSQADFVNLEQSVTSTWISGLSMKSYFNSGIMLMSAGYDFGTDRGTKGYYRTNDNKEFVFSSSSTYFGSPGGAISARCVKCASNPAASNGLEKMLGCDETCTGLNSVRISNTIWAGCDVAYAMYNSGASTCTYNNLKHFKYNISNAKNACKAIGTGWRLPGKEEFELLVKITPTDNTSKNAKEYKSGSDKLYLYKSGVYSGSNPCTSIGSDFWYASSSSNDSKSFTFFGRNAIDSPQLNTSSMSVRCVKCAATPPSATAFPGCGDALCEGYSVKETNTNAIWAGCDLNELHKATSTSCSYQNIKYHTYKFDDALAACNSYGSGWTLPGAFEWARLLTSTTRTNNSATNSMNFSFSNQKMSDGTNAILKLYKGTSYNGCGDAGSAFVYLTKTLHSISGNTKNYRTIQAYSNSIGNDISSNYISSTTPMQVRCIKCDKNANLVTKNEFFPGCDYACSEASVQIGNTLWAGCDLRENISTNYGDTCDLYLKYNRLYQFYPAQAACESVGWRLPNAIDADQLKRVSHNSSGGNIAVNVSNEGILNLWKIQASNGRCDGNGLAYWLSTLQGNGQRRVLHTTSNSATLMSGYGQSKNENETWQVRCVKCFEENSFPKYPCYRYFRNGELDGPNCATTVKVGNVLWAGCDAFGGSDCNNDIHDQFTWSKANSSCTNEGWRLPTRAEFNALAAGSKTEIGIVMSFKHPKGTVHLNKAGGGTCSNFGTSMAYNAGSPRSNAVNYFNGSNANGETIGGTPLSVRCVFDALPDGTTMADCNLSDVTIGSTIWAGCDVSPYDATPQIICTYNGRKYYGYRWDEANNACNKKGNGWRLPSQTEIKALAALNPNNYSSTNSWDYTSNGKILEMYKGVAFNGCSNDGINLSYWGSSNYNGESGKKVILYANSGNKPIVDHNGYPMNDRYGSVRCVKTVPFDQCPQITIGSTIWAGCDVAGSVKEPNFLCTATNVGETYSFYSDTDARIACESKGWRLPTTNEFNALLALPNTFDNISKTWDYGGKKINLSLAGWVRISNGSCSYQGVEARYYAFNGSQIYWYGGSPIRYGDPLGSNIDAFSIRCVKDIPAFNTCGREHIMVGSTTWAGCDVTNKEGTATAICTSPNGNTLYGFRYSNAKSACEAKGWRLPTKAEFDALTGGSVDRNNSNVVYNIGGKKLIFENIGYGGGTSCYSLGETTSYWSSNISGNNRTIFYGYMYSLPNTSTVIIDTADKTISTKCVK